MTKTLKPSAQKFKSSTKKMSVIDLKYASYRTKTVSYRKEKCKTSTKRNGRYRLKKAIYRLRIHAIDQKLQVVDKNNVMNKIIEKKNAKHRSNKMLSLST